MAPLFPLAAMACSRTGLDVLLEAEQQIPDAGAADASPRPVTRLDAAAPADASPPVQTDLCRPFPSPPPSPPAPPQGAACAFSPGATSTTPVLLAIAGQDVVGLTPQGTFVRLFTFAADASTAATTSLVLTLRGDFAGAMVITQSDAGPDLWTYDVEFVLLRLDGTALAHHRESITARAGASPAGAVVGNAAGTFAFSATTQVWLAAADGRLLGPMNGVALADPDFAWGRVDPDAKGRLLAFPLAGGTGPEAVWIDLCQGSQTPSRLYDIGGTTMASRGSFGGAFGRGAELFGVMPSGQLATEDADGMTMLAVPPLPVGSGELLGGADSDHLLFALSPVPYPASQATSFLRLDETTLATTATPFALPAGESFTSTEAYIDYFDVSDVPTGFGIDSRGEIGMVLSDGQATRLEVTADGHTWTAIGGPLDGPPGAYEPLLWTEADGTFVVEENPSLYSPLSRLMIVRPSSGIDLAYAGETFLPYSGRVTRDGGCVALLRSSSVLDVVNALTGGTTTVSLPSGVNTKLFGFPAMVWVGGDRTARSFW